MSDTKKAFLADLIKKDLAWCVKSRCVAAAKHKITSTKIQNNIVMCYIKSHICLKIHTKQKWFLKIIIIIIKKNRVQNNG